MKKLLYSIALVTLAFAFAACGQNNMDIADDYNELTDSDSVSLCDKLGITSDTISYEDEIEYNGFKYYSVNADVIVPDTDKIGVYTLAETDIDEDYAEEMVASVFDNGDFTKITWDSTYDETDAYVNPEQMIEDLEKILSDPNEDHLIVDYYKWCDANNYINGNEKNYADYLYEGYMNGTRVLAGFLNHTDKNASMIYIIRDGNHDEQYTVTTVDDAERTGLDKTIECAYTAEEAQEIAEEFLSELGLNEYGMMHYDYKMSADENGILEPSGYIFYYGLEINNATTLYKRMLMSWGSITQENFSEAVGQITIGVDSNGIFFFEASSPYTICGTDTDDAELLSFSQINEEFSNIMENESYNQLYTTTSDFTEVRLGYYITKDENGELILLPAWGFYNNYRGYIYINAINGEELDANEDFYK